MTTLPFQNHAEQIGFLYYFIAAYDGSLTIEEMKNISFYVGAILDELQIDANQDGSVDYLDIQDVITRIQNHIPDDETALAWVQQICASSLASLSIEHKKRIIEDAQALSQIQQSEKQEAKAQLLYLLIQSLGLPQP